MQKLAGLLIAFTVVGLVLALLERSFPAIRGRKLWRRGIGTDLTYWALRPLILKPIAKVTTGLAVVALALAAGAELDRAAITEWITGSNRAVGRLPVGIQLVLGLLVADFVSYWCHRSFHQRSLWRFHAVHHSSEELDFLAAVRAHPVNEIISSGAHALVLVALGFRLDVLAAVVPLLGLWGVLLHANVPWTFGPLKYVLASPTFHRWHHTSQQEGLDKNFAGLFPVWDLIFGTFYMPEGRIPERFGVVGERVPDGFFKQLAWPFKAAR